MREERAFHILKNALNVRASYLLGFVEFRELLLQITETSVHGSSTVGDTVSRVLEIKCLPEHLQEIASQVGLDDSKVGLEENEAIH